MEALTSTGRTKPTPLEEVMELYQIGRFLELEIVTQGCEDLILEWLTLETLPIVLRYFEHFLMDDLHCFLNKNSDYFKNKTL